MDWKTVRYDPDYEDRWTQRMIPLCDAPLKCRPVHYNLIMRWSWHTLGPYVQFEHSSDERIERLARFVKGTEHFDYRPYFTMWEKEILEDGILG